MQHETRHANDELVAMIKVKSSRPAEGLKPGDYDHEIFLQDHDGATSLQAVTLAHTTSDGEEADVDADAQRISTNTPLLPATEQRSDQVGGQVPLSESQDDDARLMERPLGEQQHENELAHPALRPCVEVQCMSAFLSPFCATVLRDKCTYNEKPQHQNNSTATTPMSRLTSRMPSANLPLTSYTRMREGGFSAAPPYFHPKPSEVWTRLLGVSQTQHFVRVFRKQPSIF